MKIFDIMSLRVRLTLFTGMILLISCILFSFASIFSARDSYVFPENMVANDEKTISIRPPQTDKEVDLQKIKEIQDDEFAVKNVIFAALIIIFGTVSAYFIVGKAMRPVAVLSRDIKNIDESSLSYRISVPSSNDEVADLAYSFNGMIDRVEKAYISQKNFSANAAHELRTPLSGIIASIEVLLLDDKLDEDECCEVLNDCLKNAERLNNLVNDLLEMNNSFSLNSCKVIEIDKMFDNIIRDLSNEISERCINVSRNVSNISLFGEERLIYRALFNLCHNAVKYNRSDGNIIIYTYETDRDVCICIENTGNKIPSDDLERIFEPFYCVDKSRSRELGGNGLGLSIVKAIADKFQGSVSAVSNEEKTSFTITLPKRGGSKL